MAPGARVSVNEDAETYLLARGLLLLPTLVLITLVLTVLLLLLRAVLAALLALLGIELDRASRFLVRTLPIALRLAALALLRILLVHVRDAPFVVFTHDRASRPYADGCIEEQSRYQRPGGLCVTRVPR
jgi:hypothetical protein